MNRSLFLALVALLGCGGSATVEEGCYVDERVPKAVREELAASALLFYDRIRAQDWQAIYDNASSAVRRGSTSEEFLGSIARAVSSIGLPAELATRSVSLVKFGAGFPYQRRVSCRVEGKEDPLVLLLNDHPEQGSLVQVGTGTKDAFFYSTLWLREEGEWHLGVFFVKPATLHGKDANDYAEEAAVQEAKENLRNAALLYNVALDLAVPTAWMKPPEIDELQRAQRRLQVMNLPAGESLIDVWGADPDTFQVARVSYAVRGDELGLVVRYLSQGAIEDTTFQDGRARELVEVMRADFPEYLEVFSSVTVQAYDAEGRAWHHADPFRSGR